MMQIMDINEIIEKCRKRDHIAWDRFIKDYKGMVVRIVRFKVKKWNYAISNCEFEDIVQEIFLDIWEKDLLKTLKSTANFKHWLIMVVMNKTSNYCKKKMRNKTDQALSLDCKIEEGGNTLTFYDIIKDKCEESKLEYVEAGDHIDRELNKLDIRSQLAMKLNIYDGKRHEDIAAIMNIPRNTVSTLISRAKKKVQINLKQKEIFYE
jgi:RNA polymerase sigma factor (sigma-70 family)